MPALNIRIGAVVSDVVVDKGLRTKVARAFRSIQVGNAVSKVTVDISTQSLKNFSKEAQVSVRKAGDAFSKFRKDANKINLVGLQKSFNEIGDFVTIITSKIDALRDIKPKQAGLLGGPEAVKSEIASLEVLKRELLELQKIQSGTLRSAARGGVSSTGAVIDPRQLKASAEQTKKTISNLVTDSRRRFLELNKGVLEFSSAVGDASRIPAFKNLVGGSVTAKQKISEISEQIKFLQNLSSEGIKNFGGETEVKALIGDLEVVKRQLSSISSDATKAINVQTKSGLGSVAVTADQSKVERLSNLQNKKELELNKARDRSLKVNERIAALQKEQSDLQDKITNSIAKSKAEGASVAKTKARIASFVGRRRKNEERIAELQKLSSTLSKKQATDESVLARTKAKIAELNSKIYDIEEKSEGVSSRDLVKKSRLRKLLAEQLSLERAIQKERQKVASIKGESFTPRSNAEILAGAKKKILGSETADISDLDSDKVRRAADIATSANKSARKELRELNSERKRAESGVKKQNELRIKLQKAIEREIALEKQLELQRKRAAAARGLSFTARGEGQIRRDVESRALGSGTTLSSASTTQLQQGLDRVSQSTKEAKSNIAQYTRALRAVESGSISSEQAIRRHGTALQKFGQQSRLAIKRYSAYLLPTTGLFAVISAVRSSISAFSEFESEQTKLLQILPQIESGLGGVVNQFGELAKQTGVSIAATTKTARVLAQAGFGRGRPDSGLSEQQAQQNLASAAIDISRATLAPTFGETEETIDGLIAVLSQFGLELQDTGRILDVTNQLAKDFAVDSNDIFEAVKKGGAAFSTLGGSYEEFAGLLSLLRERTRESAATLGVFFKTGGIRLFSANAAAALRQLDESILATKTLPDRLDALASAFTRLSGQERVFFAQQLVGVRQAARLVAILDALNNVGTRLETSLAAAGGSIDRDVSKRVDDLSVQFQKLRESINEAVRGFIEDDTIQFVIRGFTRLASGIANVFESLSGILAPALGIGAAVGGAKLLGSIAKGPSRRQLELQANSAKLDENTRALQFLSRSILSGGAPGSGLGGAPAGSRRFSVTGVDSSGRSTRQFFTGRGNVEASAAARAAGFTSISDISESFSRRGASGFGKDAGFFGLFGSGRSRTTSALGASGSRTVTEGQLRRERIRRNFRFNRRNRARVANFARGNAGSLIGASGLLLGGVASSLGGPAVTGGDLSTGAAPELSGSGVAGSLIGGALSGAGAGALIGSAGGPIGTAIGAAVGGIIGGASGLIGAFTELSKRTEEFQNALKSQAIQEFARTGTGILNKLNAAEIEFAEFSSEAGKAIREEATGSGGTSRTLARAINLDESQRLFNSPLFRESFSKALEFREEARSLISGRASNLERSSGLNRDDALNEAIKDFALSFGISEEATRDLAKSLGLFEESLDGSIIAIADLNDKISDATQRIASLNNTVLTNLEKTTEAISNAVETFEKGIISSSEVLEIFKTGGEITKIEVGEIDGLDDLSKALSRTAFNINPRVGTGAISRSGTDLFDLEPITQEQRKAFSQAQKDISAIIEDSKLLGSDAESDPLSRSIAALIEKAILSGDQERTFLRTDVTATVASEAVNRNLKELLPEIASVLQARQEQSDGPTTFAGIDITEGSIESLTKRLGEALGLQRDVRLPSTDSSGRSIAGGGRFLEELVANTKAADEFAEAIQTIRLAVSNSGGSVEAEFAKIQATIKDRLEDISTITSDETQSQLEANVSLRKKLEEVFSGLDNLPDDFDSAIQTIISTIESGVFDLDTLEEAFNQTEGKAKETLKSALGITDQFNEITDQLNLIARISQLNAEQQVEYFRTQNDLQKQINDIQSNAFKANIEFENARIQRLIEYGSLDRKISDDRIRNLDTLSSSFAGLIGASRFGSPADIFTANSAIPNVDFQQVVSQSASDFGARSAAGNQLSQLAVRLASFARSFTGESEDDRLSRFGTLASSDLSSIPKELADRFKQFFSLSIDDIRAGSIAGLQADLSIAIDSNRTRVEALREGLSNALGGATNQANNLITLFNRGRSELITLGREFLQLRDPKERSESLQELNLANQSALSLISEINSSAALQAQGITGQNFNVAEALQSADLLDLIRNQGLTVSEIDAIRRAATLGGDANITGTDVSFKELIDSIDAAAAQITANALGIQTPDLQNIGNQIQQTEALINSLVAAQQQIAQEAKTQIENQQNAVLTQMESLTQALENVPDTIQLEVRGLENIKIDLTGSTDFVNTIISTLGVQVSEQVKLAIDNLKGG